MLLSFPQYLSKLRLGKLDGNVECHKLNVLVRSAQAKLLPCLLIQQTKTRVFQEVLYKTGKDMLKLIHFVEYS